MSNAMAVFIRYIVLNKEESNEGSTDNVDKRDAADIHAQNKAEIDLFNRHRLGFFGEEDKEEEEEFNRLVKERAEQQVKGQEEQQIRDRQGRIMRVDAESEEEIPVQRRRKAGQGRTARNNCAEENIASIQEDDSDSRWRLREFLKKLCLWDEHCLLCKVTTGFEASDHRIEGCIQDDEKKAIILEGIKQIRVMNEPIGEQGKCWVGWQRCEIEANGEQGRICKWSRMARTIAITVLYVGSRAEEAQEWVAQDERFLSEVEEDGFGALKRFLKQEVDWNGVKSNMLCELVWRFG